MIFSLRYCTNCGQTPVFILIGQLWTLWELNTCKTKKGLVYFLAEITWFILVSNAFKGKFKCALYYYIILYILWNGVKPSMIIKGNRIQKCHQISISPWGGSCRLHFDLHSKAVSRQTWFVAWRNGHCQNLIRAIIYHRWVDNVDISF